MKYSAVQGWNMELYSKQKEQKSKRLKCDTGKEYWKYLGQRKLEMKKFKNELT